MLSLHCCTGSSLVAVSRGYSLVAECSLLIMVASLSERGSSLVEALGLLIVMASFSHSVHWDTTLWKGSVYSSLVDLCSASWSLMLKRFFCVAPSSLCSFWKSLAAPASMNSSLWQLRSGGYPYPVWTPLSHDTVVKDFLMEVWAQLRAHITSFLCQVSQPCAVCQWSRTLGGLPGTDPIPMSSVVAPLWSTWITVSDALSLSYFTNAKTTAKWTTLLVDEHEALDPQTPADW